MPDPQSANPTTPPPPDAPVVEGQGDGGKMDHFRSILSRLSGGGTTAIDKTLQDHYNKRYQEAQLAKQQLQATANAYRRAQASGADQKTLDTLTQQYDIAEGNYSKIAGQGKESKPLIQQTLGVLRHVIGHPKAGQPMGAGAGGSGSTTPSGQPQSQSQGARPAATPAPPDAPDPAQGGTEPQGPTTPPPPSPSASPSQSMLGMGAAEGDRLSRGDDDTRRAAAAKGAEASAGITGVAEGLRKEGFTDDQIKSVLQAKYGGAGLRQKMHPIKVMDPDDPTKTIPGLQSTVPDENGQYPVYDSQGKVIANPTQLVPSMLPTQKTGEMPVFDPTKNEIVQQPTYSTSQKVAPKGARPATTDGPPKPGSSRTGAGSGSPSPSPGAGGRHGIPMRQFSILQKQATSIDEARNSLIGDDPQQVGGLAADLDIFRDPESVKKVGQYLQLVNNEMANEAKAVTGQGAVAAAEWYVGLPQAVVGLQQGALRDASASLSPAEQRFVADYYRVLGTIGGMRASTGASSAQWSFNALKSELPTPGPVTSYDEAKRRVKNYVQETNVVAKRNPLSKTVDAGKLDAPRGGAFVYARDPQGNLHKAKKGTPLPQGWKAENAATAK